MTLRVPSVAIYSAFFYHRYFKSHKSFNFDGERLRYFLHPYNFTWANERCVEIPIVLRYLKNAGQPVLEVGSVLSHYFEVKHDIWDKYEEAPGVQNVDAAYFATNARYRFIFSISTLEHIGMQGSGEESADTKTLKAIRNLVSVLLPSGKIVATVPLGFNSAMDSLVGDEAFFSRRFFMKRISRESWVPTDYDDVKDARYGRPFKYANAICVWTIER